MTVKEYREKYMKDLPLFESLSERDKANIRELTTGITVTFIPRRNSIDTPATKPA